MKERKIYYLCDRSFLEFVIIFPIMFSAFPIPLAFPVALIAIGAEKGGVNWIPAIVFLSWLFLSIMFFVIMDLKGYDVH